jgi:HD superfamily phosphodiesterase
MYIDFNPIEEKIYQLAKAYLLTIRNDDLHVRNALDFAFKLLETEHGDRGIVIPAIILHDVGWIEVPEDIMSKAFGPAADISLTRIHEEVGVKIAANILEEVGYDGSNASEVLQIIDGHDTRENPLSINDKIVKDADKLTRYSKCLPIFASVLGLSTREYCVYLESLGEHWFFLPSSREMARVELKHWQREIEDGQFSL